MASCCRCTPESGQAAHESWLAGRKGLALVGGREYWRHTGISQTPTGILLTESLTAAALIIYGTHVGYERLWQSLSPWRQELLRPFRQLRRPRREVAFSGPHALPARHICRPG